MLMVRVFIHGKTEKYTMVNGSRAANTVLESGKAYRETHISVSGKKD
jgi:hypothetical protein